jgi:hypothetical protein
MREDFDQRVGHRVQDGWILLFVGQGAATGTFPRLTDYGASKPPPGDERADGANRPSPSHCPTPAWRHSRLALQPTTASFSEGPAACADPSALPPLVPTAAAAPATRVVRVRDTEVGGLGPAGGRLAPWANAGPGGFYSPRGPGPLAGGVPASSFCLAAAGPGVRGAGNRPPPGSRPWLAAAGRRQPHGLPPARTNQTGPLCRLLLHEGGGALHLQYPSWLWTKGLHSGPRALGPTTPRLMPMHILHPALALALCARAFRTSPLSPCTQKASDLLRGAPNLGHP